MKRWWRRTLRNYGIFRPFSAVICPRYVKAIHINEGAGVEVHIERTLVYLEMPERADLWDLVPMASDGDCQIHESPDARELLRTPTAKGTVVHWEPHTPIVPFGLYVHHRRWTSPGSSDESALFTEFRCETKTGVAVLELSTPRTFEAAIAFRWPAWRRLQSIQTCVKYSLDQLDTAQGQKPDILENGSRLQWTLVNPGVGERYACIAFHEGGVERWQNRLAANTLSSRMRRLARSFTSF
jgi:hypothetical protein